MQWLFKHIKICFIASAALLLVLGAISFIRRPSYDFETVYQLRYEDDYLYGIDFNNYSINVFRMRFDGTEFSSVELPVYQGKESALFFGKELNRSDSGWTFSEKNADSTVNTGNREFTECRTNEPSGLSYGIYVTEKGKQVPAVYKDNTVVLLQRGKYVFTERLSRAFTPYAIAFLLLLALFLFVYIIGRREKGVSLISEFIVLLYPFAVIMIIIMSSFIHDLCFSIAENSSMTNLLTDARITTYLSQSGNADVLSLRYDGQEIYILGENGEDLWKNHTDSKKLNSAQKSAQEKQPVLIRYASDDVVYDSILMAVENAEGKVDRIVEKRTNIFPNMVKVEKQADRIFHQILIAICGIILCIALVLDISARRMSTASKSVMKAGDGDIDKVPPMYGISEVPVLVRNVNRLLGRLNIYRSNFDRLNEKYKAFIPQLELELIGEDKTSDDVKVREKEINASSISYYNPDLTAENDDSGLNTVFNIMNERGLVIHHMDRKGFYGFSCRGCSMLLDSTVKMLEYDHLTNGCAALTDGIINIGMTGGKERASVFLVSSDKILCDNLARRGQGIGCSLIITDCFRDKTENKIGSYHLRLLGDMHNRNDESVTEIYEVLDVQSNEIRRLKEQTRILFEQGVRFFRENQTLKARRCFVQVMELNNSDKAAMHYIILCDTLIRNPEKATGRNYLFEYGSWE